MWFIFSISWITTAIASVAGLYFTHRPGCLWVFILPALVDMVIWNSKDDVEEESEELDNEKQ